MRSMGDGGVPGMAPMYVRRWPLISATSCRPPTLKRKYLRLRALAMDLTMLRRQHKGRLAGRQEGVASLCAGREWSEEEEGRSRRELDSRKLPELVVLTISDSTVVVVDEEEREYSVFFGRGHDEVAGCIVRVHPTLPTMSPSRRQVPVLDYYYHLTLQLPVVRSPTLYSSLWGHH